MMMKQYILFIFLTGFSLASMLAQEPQPEQKKQMIVILMDGNERIGQILSDDGREILLETMALGKIYIQKSDIRQIRTVEAGELEAFDGDVRNTGPFTTRYYFTTNALPIKKREDYAMVHIYGPEVHLSVSDNLSLGVMTTWAASPFIFAAKYAFPSKREKLHLSVGTLLGSSGYMNNFRGFGGLHWLTATQGDRMNNVSVSLGYAYLDPGFKNEHPVPGTYFPQAEDRYITPDYDRSLNFLTTAPVLSLAGIRKVGKKSSFIFDSMIFFYGRNKQDYDFDYQYSEENKLERLIVSGQGIYRERGLAMYLMPGMRVQRKANRAFQLALAGVILVEEMQNPNERELITFPIPTCSWFFKF